LDDLSIGLTTLPVTLTSFTAKTTINAVQLAWQTASEQNNSHFEILHSVNGKEFQSAGTVKGAGNSNEVKNYTFNDYNAVEGINYYQLKQYDYDGSSVLSKIISVNTGFSQTEIAVSAPAGKQEVE